MTKDKDTKDKDTKDARGPYDARRLVLLLVSDHDTELALSALRSKQTLSLGQIEWFRELLLDGVTVLSSVPVPSRRA